MGESTRFFTLEEFLQRVPKPSLAKVYLGGHLLATGEVFVLAPNSDNSFLSKSGDMPGKLPYAGAVMKIDGTNATLRLIDVLHCPTEHEPNEARHFHFRFEAILL
jgi:hypothetical protein